jgi:DNA modification methylase
MINLLHGDCLELMKNIPDNSIDMVLTDPPYGTTQCKWDFVIDFQLMWEQLKRITKDNGAICLFGSEPFSSALRMSNIKMFKYDWVWDKSRGFNFAQAKKQPMKSHEIVSIFYKKQPFYCPQMTSALHDNRNRQGFTYSVKKEIYSVSSGKSRASKDYDSKKRYPLSIQTFKKNWSPQQQVHPTQKPVALLEYLIKTYTLENETVLDFTMGSGSTGVAAKNLNRKFIGIEMDDKYFEIAKNRIESA